MNQYIRDIHIKKLIKNVIIATSKLKWIELKLAELVKYFNVYSQGCKGFCTNCSKRFN